MVLLGCRCSGIWSVLQLRSVAPAVFLWSALLPRVTSPDSMVCLPYSSSLVDIRAILAPLPAENMADMSSNKSRPKFTAISTPTLKIASPPLSVSAVPWRWQKIQGLLRISFQQLLPPVTIPCVDTLHYRSCRKLCFLWCSSRIGNKVALAKTPRVSRLPR